MPRDASFLKHESGSGYISHIVIMVQENRSFDDLFATFPGADGATQGKMKPPGGGKVQTVQLKKVPLVEKCDFGHRYQGFKADYDKGKMDGFGLQGGGKCGGKVGPLPYQYVDPNDIIPYWFIAQNYVLGDEMFQTQGSGSFSAHQDLIRGGTTYDAALTKSLVDYPSQSRGDVTRRLGPLHRICCGPARRSPINIMPDRFLAPTNFRATQPTHI